MGLASHGNPSTARHLAGKCWAVTGVLLPNLVAVFGVCLLGWNVKEVLLTYYVELVVATLAGPVIGVACYGWSGLVAGGYAMATVACFVAAQGLFLCMYLYGVNWSQMHGHPAGGAAGLGSPVLWFQRAIVDIPTLGVVSIVIIYGFRIYAAWLSVTRRPASERKRPIVTIENALGGSSMDPTGHMVVMQFVVVLGGAAILATGGSVGMLILLVILKTGYETMAAVGGRGLW